MLNRIVVCFLIALIGWAPVAMAKNQTPPIAHINAADFASLQEAVDSLPNRQGQIDLPPGKYVLNKTLDLSSPPGGYHGGIRFVGAGRSSQIIVNTPGQPAIDLTGSNHCVMENLVIDAERAQGDQAPTVGLLLARNMQAGAAQEHRFTNVNIVGHFSVANVYNVTSELCRFIGCIFINKAPGAHNLVWSAENFADIKSPYRGAIRDNYSNTELRIIGCSFYNWAPLPKPSLSHEIKLTEDLKDDPTDGLLEDDGKKVEPAASLAPSNVHIRGFTADTTIRDCYMNPPRGGFGVYLGVSKAGGPALSTHISDVRIEGENGKHAFRIEGRANLVTIRNCTVFYGEGVALKADQVSQLRLEQNHFWNVRGWKTAFEVDRLYDSRINGNFYEFHNWDGKNPQSGPARVLVAQRIARSDVEVPNRDMLKVASIGMSRINALNENGVRRQYLGGAADGTVLNLMPVDTKTIKAPKAGDVALDTGANTPDGKPTLAIYDGKAWRYMRPE